MNKPVKQRSTALQRAIDIVNAMEPIWREVPVIVEIDARLAALEQAQIEEGDADA